MEGGAVAAGERFSTEVWQAGPGFFKAHGHGNDYLVFARGEGWPVTAATVRRVCDRFRGPGADGVVIVDPAVRPFGLRMFNPDGGEFEKSGNGLRVTAAWLHRAGWVGDEPFAVVVGGARVEMTVHGRDAHGALDISADMGQARFGADAVDLRGDAALVDPDGRELDAVVVSMGNPHCVVFGRSADELERLGRWLSGHPRFQHGTNVQLATVEGRRLDIAIWERGVGHTHSSGTSACAATAAAIRSGRLPSGQHAVHMEGGVFEVSVDERWSVRLRGPVEEVMEGTLADLLLETLGRAEGS